MPGMHGLFASLQLLQDVGLNTERVSDRILENVALLEHQLKSRDFDVDVPAQKENRSGIVGVRWPGSSRSPQQLNEARKFLLREHVVTSVRGNRLRVATHAYNNDEDIDRLVHALTEFRRQATRQ
jgi:selenocysteine lyase/cysteine desulfurase